MTKPSMLLGKKVWIEHVLHTGNGSTFFVEGSTLRKLDESENPSYIVRITDKNGNNIAVLARIHGGIDGRLGVSPSYVRSFANELWGKDVPIILICCYPKQVNEYWGKDIQANKIYLAWKTYDQTIYTSIAEEDSVCVSLYSKQQEQARQMRLANGRR